MSNHFLLQNKPAEVLAVKISNETTLALLREFNSRKRLSRKHYTEFEFK